MAPRLIGACLVLWLGAAVAQEPPPPTAPQPPPATAPLFDHAHAAWDALLKKDVVVLEGGKASRLRYAAVLQERAALKGYLAELAKVGGAEFSSWSREQQMALLINAYNAGMVDKILSRYPGLESVWDLGRIFSNPFKERSIALFGGLLSLDDIEHDMLRKTYKDARVHYALNCASVSCPMLREEAYAADRLERQLDEQAVRFLSDRTRNRAAGGRLEVSRIFDWYKEDFEPRPAYFARYAKLLSDDVRDQEAVAAGRLPLTFVEYDWALNDVRK